MNRCVLVGGAAISDYGRVNRCLRDTDYFVFCDGGLNHLPRLQAKPNLIVGDFDSHPRPDTEVETIVLPRAKDDTDSFFAAKEALRRGFSDFLLLGLVGGRLDHTLGNVSLLLYLHEHRVSARMMDDYSLMEIVSPDRPAVVDGSFSYFSLLCIGGAARGIRIAGAKFPLENGEITPSWQFGVSNEVLPGHRAEISLREGRLLLIKDFPESTGPEEADGTPAAPGK